MGKRVRGCVSRPQSHLLRRGATQEMGAGLRHTPWSMPHFSHCWLGDRQPPHSPLCKDRLASTHPEAAPTAPRDQ